MARVFRDSHLRRCRRDITLPPVAPAVDIRQGKDHAEGNSRRSDVTEKREERAVVSFLHRRYMGELLPALLPHLLLL